MKVLDLGVALAGPTCGRMLAEFGADVVKLSAPGNAVSGHLNRGKRSILVDLGTCLLYTSPQASNSAGQRNTR